MRLTRVCLVAPVAALVLGALAVTSAPAGPALAAVTDWDPGDDTRNNATGDVALLSPVLPPMVRGQAGWVSLLWSTETDVCEVRATARTSSGEVGYPANTASYSSFYVNDALAEGNLDFTAFRVKAPSSGPMKVAVEVRYTRLASSLTLRKFDDLVRKDVRGADCSGVTGSRTFTIDVPLLDTLGPPVVALTPQVTVRAGSPTWVDLSWRGNTPGMSNVRVTLAPPAGLSVVYPGDGASSGLAKDADLAVASTDSSGVRLAAAKPGLFTVPVTLTWGSTGRWTGSLRVKVLP
ncbi:hypothetical protein [Nocardioides houyundeii]|uniref:hypothetical protein n=1 Tax=Nocardioides houyundeii TaxID=2045452 RepID=UPI000C790BE8|nr:hypothetical protein [Nocardioides houyundeii]